LDGPIFIQQDDLARRHLLDDLEPDIGERAAFRRDGPSLAALAHDQRRIAEPVAGRINPCPAEQQQRARAPDGVEHLVDAVHQVRAQADELGDQLGGVHDAPADFAERHALFQQSGGQLVGVFHNAVRGQAERPELRVQVDGLLLQGADDADALVALHVPVVLEELGFELALADVVDLAREFPAEDCQSAVLRAEVGMIIGTVQENFETTAL